MGWIWFSVPNPRPAPHLSKPQTWQWWSDTEHLHWQAVNVPPFQRGPNTTAHQKQNKKTPVFSPLRVWCRSILHVLEDSVPWSQKWGAVVKYQRNWGGKQSLSHKHQESKHVPGTRLQIRPGVTSPCIPASCSGWGISRQNRHFARLLRVLGSALLPLYFPRSSLRLRNFSSKPHAEPLTQEGIIDSCCKELSALNRDVHF